MLEQQKWEMVERNMRLVRTHYLYLKEVEAGRSVSMQRRQQVRMLRRWLQAINRAYEALRCKEGKSAARAQRDWLVSRYIEMAVYDRGNEEDVRMHLTGRGRMLNQRYAEEIKEEAMKAVRKAAEEEGLIR